MKFSNRKSALEKRNKHHKLTDHKPGRIHINTRTRTIRTTEWRAGTLRTRVKRFPTSCPWIFRSFPRGAFPVPAWDYYGVCGRRSQTGLMRSIFLRQWHHQSRSSSSRVTVNGALLMRYCWVSNFEFSRWIVFKFSNFSVCIQPLFTLWRFPGTRTYDFSDESVKNYYYQIISSNKICIYGYISETKNCKCFWWFFFFGAPFVFVSV